MRRLAATVKQFSRRPTPVLCPLALPIGKWTGWIDVEQDLARFRNQTCFESRLV